MKLSADHIEGARIVAQLVSLTAQGRGKAAHELWHSLSTDEQCTVTSLLATRMIEDLKSLIEGLR